MMPDRLLAQFEAAVELGPDYIIGSKLIREPEDSRVAKYPSIRLSKQK